MIYDTIIIGGGIAGLQSAIQLGRYKHNVLVIDAGEGRSSICHCYHNVLGYPDGVSGPELRSLGRKHAEKLGAQFAKDQAVTAEKTDEGFMIGTESGRLYQGKTLMISTGIMDRLPPFPELMPCLGMSVYVCPDCDGYEVSGRETVVMGSGNPGANMALTLNYWTSKLTYVNHEGTAVDDEILAKMEEKGITYVKEPIARVMADEADFAGVELENGEMVKGERGFVAFGGNEVKSQLARQLGVELHTNKHILVNPRTKMTNVQNVWAGGDVVAHSEQVTIAMGDGMQAAIWIHKVLMGAKLE
ncbi:NAD(P)/FAD-dependent oxidoreductase [Bacillus sp. FJAT-27251]|uniref:NAD(P)/FAD-dependent oxidoreductase n=1 Tax=Bacillus sp. FJAT-27251 TaxID=1684142 RepID=UPI0006A75D41|nr:NAD(P)/FAD-dependent oxidoreductase [Bacillus sp. FJAT-27251]